MFIRFLVIPIPLLISWGGDGHAIVTHVAKSLATERGNRFVENLVGEDFIEASRWADTPEASSKYPDSDNYHFSHTPYRDCREFDIDRDCGFPGKEGLCIVTGLADAIMMAIDPDVERNDRADALKFVLHFMADIHQPLHTGFREDAGGTAIDISNAPNATLHTVWDYGLIENQLQGKSWESMSESILISVNSNQRKFVSRLASQQNITEILKNGTRDRLVEYIGKIASDTSMTVTCKIAYMNEERVFIESGDYLTEKYYRQGQMGVQVQLSKASVRLGLLIDAMADIFAARRAEQKEELRALRIGKLFEESRRIAAEKAARVHNPLEGNRFAILSIEFDEEDYLYESDGEVVDIPVPTGLSKKQIKELRAARRAQEARRVKNKLKRDERKRITRFVDGIDLNSLVLIKRSGRFFVTYQRFVTSRVFYPLQYHVIFVRFLNQGEGDEPIGFLLDRKIFRLPPTTEFLVQMFKAMKGEDDDTAGAESFGTDTVTSVESFEIRRDRNDRSDPITSFLLGMDESPVPFPDRDGKSDDYIKQFKSVDERIRYEQKLDEMNIAKLEKFKHDVIVVSAHGLIFVSAMRFCNNPAKTKFVVNKHSLIDSRASIEHNFALMIDQRMLDEDITPGALKFVQRAIFSPRVAKRSSSLSEVNPILARNLPIFAEAFGTKRADVDIVMMARFNKFEAVHRPDKPLLVTFLVDLSVDPSRLAMLEALGGPLMKLLMNRPPKA
jgi:hypothetical protein